MGVEERVGEGLEGEEGGRGIYGQAVKIKKK